MAANPRLELPRLPPLKKARMYDDDDCTTPNNAPTALKPVLTAGLLGASMLTSGDLDTPYDINKPIFDEAFMALFYATGRDAVEY